MQVTEEQLIGVYDDRNEALYAIRLYCVQQMMNKISLFDTMGNFVTLIDKGEYVIYENPIGYFPIGYFPKTKVFVK